MRLPLRPSPAVTAAGVAVAYGAFVATFRGPRERFWQRMTGTGVVLGGLALATDASVRESLPKVKAKDLVAGGAIAATLYVVFQVGDRAARVIMPHGADDIGDVYLLRTLRPVPELAGRLAFVIAPAEELFWRGMLQNAFSRRLGPVKGAAAAAAVYGAAHLCTGNATLVGAASVAGLSWSALAAAGVPMPALVASHVVWDIWIFLVQPTQALA